MQVPSSSTEEEVMKAVLMTAAGSPKVLQVQDVQNPAVSQEKLKFWYNCGQLALILSIYTTDQSVYYVYEDRL
jgi:hypothetical protein